VSTQGMGKSLSTQRHIRQQAEKLRQECRQQESQAKEVKEAGGGKVATLSSMPIDRGALARRR
jgi:hypothetical protein